jgi:hypothetical protein
MTNHRTPSRLTALRTRQAQAKVEAARRALTTARTALAEAGDHRPVAVESTDSPEQAFEKLVAYSASMLAFEAADQAVIYWSGVLALARADLDRLDEEAALADDDDFDDRYGSASS